MLQTDLFGPPPAAEPVRKTRDAVGPPSTPPLPAVTEPYACPCCRHPVFDEYVEGDALCFRCRDIDDPRLSRRERLSRQGRPQPSCCAARQCGQHAPTYDGPPVPVLGMEWSEVWRERFRLGFHDLTKWRDQ